jgi:predicted Zn-dependent peptidase
MILPLLLATLAVGDSVVAVAPRVETGLSAQGVALTVHRQPSVPLVALRLALVASDPAGYAGAGHLYQHIVHGALRERAAQVGARVLLERSADAVVFTITGPSEELDYMAGVLRDILRPAPADDVPLLQVSRELAEERLAEWETAERHVRSALRLRLFPADISAAGTEPSAVRLADGATWRQAWLRMYRPDRVSITAVGDVRLEQVSAAFGELPAAAEPRGFRLLRDTVSTVPLAPAEATRAWTGAAYSAGEIDPAVVSVAARIVSDRLGQRLNPAGTAVEHWWTHHGQALALIATVPGNQLAEAQPALGTAMADAGRTVTAAQVTAAARTVRRELLFYSRTPDRMAGLIGQFSDRTGNADEAQRFYDRLGQVTAREVRDALVDMQERTPVRIDIPPQRLMRR